MGGRKVGELEVYGKTGSKKAKAKDRERARERMKNNQGSGQRQEGTVLEESPKQMEGRESNGEVREAKVGGRRKHTGRM